MFEKFDFNQVPKISQFYLDDEGTMIVFDAKMDGDKYKGRFCKKGQELERFERLTLQELQFLLNPNEEGEIKHQKFDTIKKIVKLNQPIYLFGPAGTGKNVICKQVADDLGIEFYFASSVTQEYKIVGYTEANSLKGMISNESPLGMALRGKKKGDVVELYHEFDVKEAGVVNTENCKVVVLVTSAVDSKFYVENVIECPVGQSVPFGYVD